MKFVELNKKNLYNTALFIDKQIAPKGYIMSLESPLIRPERRADHKAISELTLEAFKDQEYSSHTEHLIIDALREQQALTVSLVAELDNHIVGHIAFSPVQIGDELGWFGLGPVAVKKAFQGQGIGSALIKEGLKLLNEEHNAVGCVVLGNPNYYRRVGFNYNPHIIFEDAPPEYFMTIAFHDNHTAGSVLYHSAFFVTASDS